MIQWAPPAVTIAGLLIYAFANNKAARVGEIMFFAGLLATLLHSGIFRL